MFPSPGSRRISTWLAFTRRAAKEKYLELTPWGLLGASVLRHRRHGVAASDAGSLTPHMLPHAGHALPITAAMH
jgi:hypothetical protein